MVKIEKIIPGGFGLGDLEDGKKIFLWNTLPGEEVEEFKILKKKSHFVEAISTKFSNPSQFRVTPKDDCYLSTSPWQIFDYDYELKTKQNLVVEFFREHGITISLPEIFTDYQDYFYRNKMEYSLYYNFETEKIEPSFHYRHSRRKIPIKKSSIERPEIFKRALEIIEDLNRCGEEARKYQSLVLRCNQKGEVSGGLYEKFQPHPTFENLTDEILGIPYSYSPNGFFQINLPVYEMALKEIKKHIKTDNVLDLYAGVGTIGLSVASDRHLTLVEINKHAYGELEKNCERNGNIFAVLARSEDVLSHILPNQTVILDPPRSGCDKTLIDKLCEVKPEAIIYLSCDPATQARDVKILLKNYQIETIKTFNFFPRTPHIENLVILKKL